MDDLHEEYNGHQYRVSFSETSKGSFRWVAYVDHNDVLPMEDRPMNAEWAMSEGRSAAINYIKRKYGAEPTGG